MSPPWHTEIGDLVAARSLLVVKHAHSKLYPTIPLAYSEPPSTQLGESPCLRSMSLARSALS